MANFIGNANANVIMPLFVSNGVAVAPAFSRPSAVADLLDGQGGADVMDGGGGNDTLLGGFGNDLLFGNTGADVLRGLNDADTLLGDAGMDTLIGGLGNDVFYFNAASHSIPGASDVVAAGDGAAAFQGVGAAAGDLIDVSRIDANTDPGAAGNNTFVFIGVNAAPGVGQISVFNNGNSTIIRANTSMAAGYEFQFEIQDGAVVPGAYVAGDFIL